MKLQTFKILHNLVPKYFSEPTSILNDLFRIYCPKFLKNIIFSTPPDNPQKFLYCCPDFFSGGETEA